MSEEFPIDIDCNKITEWLLERRKISKDYNKQSKALQLKTQQVCDQISEQKDEEIIQFVQQNQQNMDYFIINQVIDKLTATEEGKQKNFFGSYQSKVVHQWMILKKLFEKNNLSLVNLSRVIKQNLFFEMPSLKQNQKLYENQIQDFTQKNIDNLSSQKTNQQNLLSQLKKLGIDKQNLSIEETQELEIEKEIKQIYKEVPKMFEEIIKGIQDPLIQKGLDYYYQYITYLDSEVEEKEYKLQILEYIGRHGDESVQMYEKRMKNEEVSEEDVRMNEERYKGYFQEKKKEEEVHEINWDNNDYEVSGMGEEQGEQVHEIEWDIEVEQTGMNQEEQEMVLTLLGHKQSRDQLIDDLSELEHFIRMRIEEQKQYSSSSILLVYDHQYQSQIYEQSSSVLCCLQTLLSLLLSQLSSYKLTTLLQVIQHPLALERLSHTFNQYQCHIQRLSNNSYSNANKQNSLGQQLRDSLKQQKEMEEGLNGRKNMVEQLLKEQLNKQVRIVGKINQK